jgi:hypothetical protein
MANKKISELTAKASQIEDTDLIMISDYNGATYDTKSVTGANIRPFTTLSFVLSQASTSAPTKVYSYETEVSQTFTLARTSVGLYTLTASSALFTANKTFVTISNGIGGAGIIVGAYRASTTVISFYSSDSVTQATIDNVLDNATLEIKIIK